MACGRCTVGDDGLVAGDTIVVESLRLWVHLRHDEVRNGGHRRVVEHHRARELNPNCCCNGIAKLNSAERVQASFEERLVEVDVSAEDFFHASTDLALHSRHGRPPGRTIADADGTAADIAH